MPVLPAVSVIIPARDAEATLARTLDSLAAQDLEQPYEVVVVDDGSSDGTAAVTEADRGLIRGPVTVIRQGPLGPAEARNRGAAAASAEVLAFTDADCFPRPGWLREGLRALTDADLVVGAVLPDPLSPLGPFDRSLWVTWENGLYETANLFVTREVFNRVGGFEAWLQPRIGKAMAEDVWFGWQARRVGARTCFCREALVHHAVFSRRPRDYVLERRRLRYFPDMAARMPELRERLFFARYFLNRRSAAFDAALAGVAAAALTRSPFALMAGVPYGWMVLRQAGRPRRFAADVAAAGLAADFVGFTALVRGSVRCRTLLL